MCGISGELRLDGAAPDEAVCARMLRCLERRGPDHQGRFSEGPLTFGHRRLAVIDLSAAAHQPMIDGELVLVFNGTIYNYPGLRSELRARGHTFHSHGDSEVILKAYRVWGEACVEHLIGVFAFAIWDRNRRRLLLARDRLGIKPLYYSRTAAALRFASTTQALFAAGDVDTAIDAIALHHHLTLHAVVPAPRTIIKGVRKLPPAHTLTCGLQGDEAPRRYWCLNARRPAVPKPESAWIEATRDALQRAVQRRSQIADVPVGVLLSGGLDSSLLVGLLAASGVQGLKTYTVGFEDQPEEKGNEFEYADRVAARYGTENHQFSIPNDELLERLPEAVDHMAEPMVGQDAVAFYLLAERVAGDIKVIQTGQGADEVFGGYFWYRQMAGEPSASPEAFRKHYFDRGHDEFTETVAPQYIGADFTSALIGERLAEGEADTFMDAVLRMDATTLLVDDPVKRVDNMTMAWGLEARVPFLDHELVELAMQMPPELKLKEGGKHPLKCIARGLLPDSVIDRPKGYFPVPALKYVRGRFLEQMRDILDSRACRERGLFQRGYVERLLANPGRHLTPLKGNKLWHLALLELWLQRHIDNPG